MKLTKAFIRKSAGTHRINDDYYSDGRVMVRRDALDDTSRLATSSVDAFRATFGASATVDVIDSEIPARIAHKTRTVALKRSNVVYDSGKLPLRAYYSKQYARVVWVQPLYLALLGEPPVLYAEDGTESGCLATAVDGTRATAVVIAQASPIKADNPVMLKVLSQ